MKRNFTRFLNISAMFMGTLLFSRKVSATSIADALSKSSAATGDMTEAYANLTSIVYLIIAFGGFWIVGMLVWGAMTLAGSGGNPQKRTEGFIKISLTIVGAYIIYKSYDIAGYAMSFG